MSKAPTIALSMIVKDEVASLRRCLATIAPFVDAIYITHTGEDPAIKQVCAEFTAHYTAGTFHYVVEQPMVDWLTAFLGYPPASQVGDKLFRFDTARNFAFQQVPKDYDFILWLDADDVFRGGEQLRAVAKLAQDNGVEATYFPYLYQVEADAEGRITHVLIEHLRERLVVNTGVYKWVAPIHETLIEQKPTRKTDNYDCDVVHLATMDDRLASMARNIKSLELSIYETKGEDPRPVYYLAKALFDHRTPEMDERVIPLVTTYLYGEHKSGWPEERAQACGYLAEVYQRKGEYNNAIKAALNGLIEDPESPALYLSLALSYLLQSQWERALFWVKQAAGIPEKKTTLVMNPKDMQVKTLEVIYNACLNLAKIDEAWAAAVKLVELLPNEPAIVNAYQGVEQLRTQRDLTKQLIGLADYLTKSGEVSKVKALLAAAPAIVADNPFLTDLYHKHNPPKLWENDEIAIYCGPGFTTWSPKTLTGAAPGFMGGSEEAVVEIARALGKQGFRVTVYGDPGTDEGEYEGVTYQPYFKFNRLDRFNIVIAWRGIGFFDQPINAKKTVLWLHDIQNPLEYTEERLARIDKVFFLSQWHRDNVPSLPASKVVLTSNGIPI